MVKSLSIVLCAWFVMSGQMQGQFVPSGGGILDSHSGQFRVHSVHRVTQSATNQSFRVSVGSAWGYMVTPTIAPRSQGAIQELDPALLATTCERIKGEILAKLGLQDEWRGRGHIDLNINTLMPEDTDPVLTVVYDPRSWRYELELPSQIKPQRLALSLVHAILLEMANRNASGESTRIPYWLVEGMMAQVQMSTSPALVLQRNQNSGGDLHLLPQPNQLRLKFRAHPPLTFQQLSWPPEEQLQGKEEEYYRTSAQLFVYELLQFKDGQQCLCRFLQELPQYLNWQVAFLRAYQNHFATMLEVEKWWALNCVKVTGQDITDCWTPQESELKLAEALSIPVRVHVATNRLPDQASVTLQAAILQWSPSLQKPALERVLARLASLRVKISPELAPVLDGYTEVIYTYLHTHAPKMLTWIKADNSSPSVREAACRRLGALDKQFAAAQAKIAMLPKDTTEAPTQISARSTENTVK